MSFFIVLYKMGYVLFVMSIVSLIFQIFLGTLALAAALYYLAELVEEFTNLTSKIIRITIWITTVTYVLLLCFESLPTSVIVLGFVSQLLHLSLLTHFPYFYISSPPFILAVGVFLAQHYFAFSHFNSHYYTPSEILAYFTLCVWLVPFGFFISLSANENILPTRAETTPLLNTNDDFVTGYFSKQGGKRYGLLSFFNYLREEFFPQRAKKAF